MLEPHLKNRVGRRLFLRFLAITFLPMAAVAWYAYANVSTLLLDTTHERLKQDGKAFGMSLMEDLALYASSLRHAAGLPDGASARGPILDLFSSLTTIDPAALPPGHRHRLARGNVALDIAPDGTATLQASDRNGAVLSGRLERDVLWRNDTSPEHYCVLDTSLAPLYCTPGMRPPDSRRLASYIVDGKNGGILPREIGGEERLVGFWGTRYLPAFDRPGFFILVATSRADALKALDQFRYIFPAIVVLALALAIGLTVNQIRRQLTPLDKLEDGARRLADGDLDVRIELTGRDEIASLGQSFNRMARNLRYKFNMIETLAELDRAILGASELASVIQAMLERIPKAMPCDGAGFLKLDRPDGGTLLICRDRRDSGSPCRRTEVTTDGFPPQAATQPWFAIPADANPELARRLSQRPVSHVLAFPAQIEDQQFGYLLLACAQESRDAEELVQAGRSLADRVVIAASSFAWEDKLYHLAHYDALTGLPNRVLLRDRLEQAIRHADRTRESIALMLIDLDNFKEINDSLGHQAGDRLLVEHAHRLQRNVRQDDTVARLGGDEFLILVPGLAHDREYATLDSIARKLNDVLAEPVMLERQQVVSSASIGIAIYPENAGKVEELLKMADAAMYESKNDRPGGFHFYTSALNERTRARFELAQDLREAVSRNELVMYFQPKVEAATGRLAGAEALVRWQSPTRGLVPPGKFIPLLDEMGLATWLGEWVLDTVCRQMKDWDVAGFPALPVSINFSPVQFERTPVLERIQAALARNGLDPGRLELEILEATVVSESGPVRETLLRLRDYGIDIALDDFGTGFSSLVYLARLPANIIKLDRVFTSTLLTERHQKEIVQLIISLAKILNFKVVAEGVEEKEQLDLLAEMGCDLIQGYYIGHPIPADAYAERWLSSAAQSTVGS